MISRLLENMNRISPWHFVWISIVASELITYVLSTIQGHVWWGGVSRETLIIGAVDSLVVPLIVATIVVYFVRQTAELQKAYLRLEDANRQLQELDRQKSDFVSVVSHELRTPLTTIKAFVELLIIKPKMPEPQKTRLLGLVNAESDRLARLVSDLLDLRRIETGSMTWRKGEVDLPEVISCALASMGPLFEAKGIRISSVLSPRIPVFIGDRDRLMQVLTNIMANSLKFTPTGGAVSIEARLDGPPDPQIVAVISDTGIGIAVQDLNGIFDKFRRSSSVRADEVEGMGLGLAIAREIIEGHGGRIWAASNPGKGTTLTFTLPIPGEAAPAAT